MARKAVPRGIHRRCQECRPDDIASQITVSISSDVLRTFLEKNEQLEDEFPVTNSRVYDG